MKRLITLVCLLAGCAGAIEDPTAPLMAPEDRLAFEANCGKYTELFRPQLAPTMFPVDIVIDSDATNHDISLVLDAIDAWNARVGVELFYATVTDNLNMHAMCNYSTLTTDAVPTNNNWIGLTTYGPCASDMVHVETMNTVGAYETKDYYTDLVVKQIAMHELGHVLGLDHEKDQKSVMYESIGNDVRIITEQSACLALSAVYASEGL